MSKKRGYRSEVEVANEAIAAVEETKEEVVEEIVEEVQEVEPKKPIYTVKEIATVISFRLNIRNRPTMDSDIIATINFKDEVEVLDESTADGWVSVLLADGTKGYCVEQFIRTIK